MTTLTFKKDKETKNTIRFAEVVANEGDKPVVGMLYVAKTSPESAKEEITVDIS